MRSFLHPPFSTLSFALHATNVSRREELRVADRNAAYDAIRRVSDEILGVLVTSAEPREKNSSTTIAAKADAEAIPSDARTDLPTWVFFDATQVEPAGDDDLAHPAAVEHAGDVMRSARFCSPVRRILVETC